MLQVYNGTGEADASPSRHSPQLVQDPAQLRTLVDEAARRADERPRREREVRQHDADGRRDSADAPDDIDRAVGLSDREEVTARLLQLPDRQR